MTDHGPFRLPATRYEKEVIDSLHARNLIERTFTFPVFRTLFALSASIFIISLKGGRDVTVNGRIAAFLVGAELMGNTRFCIVWIVLTYVWGFFGAL